MEESIYIKPVSGPCDVHDWPTEGMSERLVAAMRGKGGVNRMKKDAKSALADMGIRVVVAVRNKFLLGGAPLPEWLQGQALPVIQEILESMGLHAVPRLRVEDLLGWLRETGWELSGIDATGSWGASRGNDAVYFYDRPEQVLPDDLLGTFARMLGTSVRELRETIGGWVDRRGKREFPLPDGGLLAYYPDGAVQLLGPEGSDGRELIAEVPSPLSEKFLAAGKEGG